MWSFKKIYIAVFVSLLIIGLVYAADNWYRSDSLTKIGVTNYGCENVFNDSNSDYFIPAKTESEWNAFKGHLPFDVSIEGCCGVDTYLVNYTHSDCTAVGNGYYSASGDNTRTACTNHPDTTSRNYTYTSDGNGTNNCNASYTDKCGVDLYETANGTCSAVGNGYYSVNNNNSRNACTNKPANSYYTSDGNGSATGCSWSCNTNYTSNGSSCVAIINGSCGTANNVARTTAPTTNLCSAGTATSVTSNTGNYTWTCNGINTGTSASCSAPRQYTVTYNSNGGGTASPSTKAVTYNTSVGTLATVSRTGYTFNGWYTATSLGTKITTSTKVMSNVTWYAQWTVLSACGTDTTVSAGGYTYNIMEGLDGNCWTSTNMKHVPSSGSSRCYDDDPNNCDTDGRLYDWTAATDSSVCGALGTGWSLPTDAQWTALTNAGATGWLGNKLGGLAYALPGYRYTNDYFNNRDDGGYFWSSTEDGDNDAIYRRLYSNNSAVSSRSSHKIYGNSVLCIKN